MTKPTARPSISSQEIAEKDKPKQPYPWLLKHYEEKRQRTITLVKASVDYLVKEGKTVTIEAICRTSLELDPEGRGVKKSSILENTVAHEYYRKHSTSYQAEQARRRPRGKRVGAALSAQPLRIDPKRDVDRARYRYMQMTKAEIVERLLLVEQAYAEGQHQLARLQFELLELPQRKGSKGDTSHRSQSKT